METLGGVTRYSYDGEAHLMQVVDSKSGRRICDIGTPAGAPPSEFCKDEHAVLVAAGFHPVAAGSISGIDPKTGNAVHFPMVEWKR